METLDVSILEVNLNPIVKGAKTTEYRTMSDYWMRKLVDVSKYGDGLDIVELRMAIAKDTDVPYRPYKVIRFHCGDRTFEKRIKEIRAYPCHEWFAIKLAPMETQGAGT